MTKERNDMEMYNNLDAIEEGSSVNKNGGSTTDRRQKFQ